MTDWWVVQKPQDWNPADDGFNVSLNHDYGQHDKPGGKATKAKPQNVLMESANSTPTKPKGSQSTLGQGKKAYEEYEAQKDASSGNLPNEDSWVPVDLPGKGKTRFAETFNDKFQKWQELNKNDKIELEFISGFRKTDKQAALDGQKGKRWPTAKKGTSLHEAGFAADVGNWDEKERRPKGLTSKQWEKVKGNAQKGFIRLKRTFDKTKGHGVQPLEASPTSGGSNRHVHEFHLPCVRPARLRLHSTGFYRRQCHPEGAAQR